jgi:predicted RNA-binding protein with PUA-like domain
VWDGVRNFQARSNMKKMQKGDIVFVYHTGAEKAIVGEAVVAQAAYPDPADEEWVAVDLKAGKALKNPVSLAQIKSDKRLKDMVLVRASRLSVQPVQANEYQLIKELSEGNNS